MRNELLLKVDLEPHEPYSPPSNMYLWWGPSTNHRFVGSGEHIRHLLHMGQIEGGEWRDPMFLGNNGVATFRSQRFRRISETCCSTIVIPPMEWDFPVYNIHKIIGQRIRNFVANGNMMVITGGILGIEFINSYFFYNIELADGNYSPGPYRRLDDVPVCLKAAPVVLPQKGISVTATKKESLPSGTEVLWGTPRSSPVFMIKFCEAQSPNEGMPPVKVLPRDCPAAEADGRCVQSLQVVPHPLYSIRYGMRDVSQGPIFFDFPKGQAWPGPSCCVFEDSKSVSVSRLVHIGSFL